MPQKNWFARHPIWTGIIALVLIGLLWSAFRGNSNASIESLQRDYSTGSQAESQEVNITLSGDSDTVTEPVHLARGLYFVKAAYTGRSNFIVSVINQHGDSSLIINEIGRYSGTTSINADGGDYRFQVEVGTDYTGEGFSNNAPWTLQITAS